MARGQSRVWWFVLLLSLACLVPASRSEDMARYLPGETALYVGCSGCEEAGGPQQRALEKLVKALADAEDEEARAMGKVLALAAPLRSGSVGIGLLDVTSREGQLDIQLALVADAGPQTPRLAENLRGFLSSMDSGAQISQVKVGDVELESFPLGPQFTLLWGVHRERFVAALGQTAAGKLIDCLEGRAPALAESPELKFDRQKVQARLDGRHFCIYADVQRILTRGKKLAGELLGELPPVVDQVLSELGLTSIRSKYLHIDWDQPPRMRAFAHIDGPRRGLLALWEQKPLTDEDLKVVPKDAYWMQVANLDLGAAWNEIKRVLGALAPDALPMVEGGLAMTAGMLGFSITDDLLPAFGDTWAVFDARDHGGLLLSGTVLVVEVKNAEALRGMLDRATSILTALLMQTESAGLLRRQAQHSGHTIDYIILAGIPCPVTPAWAFVGDRLVIGLYPQTVATATRQVDPQTRGPSILDHPAFQAARPQLPGRMLSVGYFDSQYFARLFYPLLQGFGAAGVSMLGQYGMEMDLELFPTLPEFVSKTNNYVGACAADPDGIIYASVGDGMPLAAVAGGTAMATSILLPSLSRSRELAKRAISVSNLRGIGMACHMYGSDHDGQFPPSLTALVEADLIAPGMLQSPRQPDAAEAYVYVGGQSRSSDSRNVLAYEKPVGDEGTNVLFVDGHVEFLDLESFRQAVRETYARLRRTDDLPEEFHE